MTVFFSPPLVRSQQFKKGQTDINVGVGFITPFFELESHDIRTKRPPLIITLDNGITDKISVGGYIGTAKSDVYGTIYWTNGTTIYSTYEKQSTLRHFILGGRLLYHFDVSLNFDVYGGGMLGYNIVTEKAEPNIELIGNNKINGFTYSILGGGRYRFSKYAGAFAELGYGITVFNLGLNIKL
jgi:hypothetical protein